MEISKRFKYCTAYFEQYKTGEVEVKFGFGSDDGPAYISGPKEISELINFLLECNKVATKNTPAS